MVLFGLNFPGLMIGLKGVLPDSVKTMIDIPLLESIFCFSFIQSESMMIMCRWPNKTGFVAENKTCFTEKNYNFIIPIGHQMGFKSDHVRENIHIFIMILIMKIRLR